ncbi:MAG: zinc ABC transporter substrate-binding protein [Streptosporangiales bacterium]|nr:zinc ABC transporter substrate-binding protein [Streptosporangiales bacterium]
MPDPHRRTTRYPAALTAALALVAVLATACGAGRSSADDAGRLRVVTTTTQVADFTRHIGGAHVAVTQLLKPNVDPHDYEPSPADIKAVADARVVVENGGGLESWLGDTVDAAGFHGSTVDTSKGVRLRTGTGEEHGRDPHIWHDPRNAKTMSANIAAALERADPAHAAAYRANLKRYAAKLDALDAWIEREIATIPPAQRKLVTNHDAFGYYVDRYHLTFVGSIIPSFDTSAELSGRQLDEIVAKIRAQHVRAIFSESSLPPKTAEAIGTRAHVRVEAGEDSLYGDTLGPAGSPGGTYIGMEEHNTRTIVGALRG